MTAVTDNISKDTNITLIEWPKHKENGTKSKPLDSVRKCVGVKVNEMSQVHNVKKNRL